MEMDHFSRGAAPEELYRKENELYEKVWQRVTANQNKMYDNGMPPSMPANTFVNLPVGAAASAPANVSYKPMEQNAAVEAAKETKEATKQEKIMESPKEAIKGKAKEAVKEVPKEAVKETAKEAVKEAPKETPNKMALEAAAKKEAKEASKEMGKKAVKGETCLGESSAVYGKQLQEAIMDELSDCEYYKRMARKFCRWSSTFLALAAEEFCHAKRLSAAYFLITGICIQPKNHEKMAPLPNCHAALRKRYLAEQAGEEKYMRMAEETEDPCLRELFIQAAEGEREHAQVIRRLLECSIYP